MIGIGISNFNRPDVLKRSLEYHLKYLPKGSKIVVVDDCSTEKPEIPDGIEVYYLPVNKGIAAVKNKCLELLDDCEHIFLFDSDTYPTKQGWELDYINAGQPHLMYSFDKWASGTPVGDDKIIYKDDKIKAHIAARGCMLYIHKSVVEKVGGFDTNYGKAMHEHLDFTTRVFNAGLTKFKVMDAANPKIYSADEYKDVSSSISRHIRSQSLTDNDLYYRSKRLSDRYCEYRENVEDKSNNIILTSYSTCGVDTQRGEQWQADRSQLDALIDSLGDEKLVVLNDCFDNEKGKVTFERVNSFGNPYFYRWLANYEYLKAHPEIDNVFCVDASDVEVVKGTKNMEKGVIYVGDEPASLANRWLWQHTPNRVMLELFQQNRTKTLLNCGVVGADRETMMDLCRYMYDLCYSHHLETVDMPAFNYLMYTKYADRIKHGREVTNVFKSLTITGEERMKHK